MGSPMGNPTLPPCGACKYLRRKCMASCVFAPYFSPDEGQRFANVHKIFGASNITKLLQDIAVEKREDAVNSICFEADARIENPVYGCVGELYSLKKKIAILEVEVEQSRKEIARLTEQLNILRSRNHSLYNLSLEDAGRYGFDSTGILEFQEKQHHYLQHSSSAVDPAILNRPFQEIQEQLGIQRLLYSMNNLQSTTITENLQTRSHGLPSPSQLPSQSLSPSQSQSSQSQSPPHPHSQTLSQPPPPPPPPSQIPSLEESLNMSNYSSWNESRASCSEDLQTIADAFLNKNRTQ